MNRKLIGILIFVVILSTQVYSLTALYNALPSKMSLNYGEKRTYPIIIEDIIGARYTYVIKIDGIETNNNGVIKVSLTDKEGHLLSQEFVNEDLTNSYVILGNNEIKKVREIYLHIEYINPLSISKKYKVQIEILPLNQQVYDSTVTSAISYALLYTFDIYANAFIYSSHYYPSSYSKENQQTLTSSNETSSYAHDPILKSETTEFNTTSKLTTNLNESLNKETKKIYYNKNEDKNQSSNEIENKDIINDSKNLTEKIDSKNDGLNDITGRMIKGANTLSVILIILGLLTMYMLWKKV